MKAEALNVRVKVMELTQSGNDWSWTEDHETWASVKRQNGRGVYSPTAVSAVMEELTIRRQDISLSNALEIDGKLRLIRSIDTIDSRHVYELTAAVVNSVTAQLSVESYELNALNNPVRQSPTVHSFPAWLAEKYVKVTDQNPETAVETGLILIAPKAVPEMATGDIVTISGKQYAVRACHLLDENRNEYEIVGKDDA